MEVRDAMVARWQVDEQRGAERKDPYVSLFALQARHAGLTGEEREFADVVLAEWVLSDSPAKRYDAVATVAKFNIHVALPAVRELARRLRMSDTPGAAHHVERLERLITELSRG